MSYLARKADVFLNEWKKDQGRYPLIVKGARQVGKTETIRRFARKNYKNVIEINFITEPYYKSIIEEGYKADSIAKLISRIDPSKHFEAGETLIFFDEIQDFPEISTALKFFKEDGKYDVICSGSLLGVQYHRIASISVGYKTDYQMHSMDFEEFLWANGYSESMLDDMLNHMLSGMPFSETERNVYSGLFLEYCILGGMPAIVSNYIDRGTFEGSLGLQRQLLTDYENDIIKYAEGLDKAKILSVYRSVPAQLAKENKKFQYSKVAKGGRSKDYMGCIEWLKDAGLINVCECLPFPELPLKGNICENKYKVYISDTGLLVASLDDEAQVDLRANRNLGVYKGALYENFAAEALVKQGYGLYYYAKENSTLKEDFFIRSANELIPVEVKANTNRARSMNQLIKSDSYEDIKHGIKLTTGNIGIDNNIVTFPYFCTFLLKRYMAVQDIFK
ncbi:MAG: AAA family ATPase [Anaerovoracaceae bacterium]|nr:AAA family ATPase [Bacillota bacterium]MDY5905650.1 AAA family ATPase [Anaerovoracaceae bacterium]